MHQDQLDGIAGELAAGTDLRPAAPVGDVGPDAGELVLRLLPGLLPLCVGAERVEFGRVRAVDGWVVGDVVRVDADERAGGDGWAEGEGEWLERFAADGYCSCLSMLVKFRYALGRESGGARRTVNEWFCSNSLAHEAIHLF